MISHKLRKLAQKIMPLFNNFMDEYGNPQNDKIEEVYEYLIEKGYDFSLGRFLFAIDELEPKIYDYLDDHEVDPRNISLEVEVPWLKAIINNKPIAESQMRL